MRNGSVRICGLLTAALCSAAGDRCALAQSSYGTVAPSTTTTSPYGSYTGRAPTASTGSGMGTGFAPGAVTPPGFVANPYNMPSMNPFLNPYAAMYAPATANNAALYFFAAQQSMGGIGSGQMSGTRPNPTAPPAGYVPIPADRRVSDTPGAGAARYFNRPVQGGGVPDRHYNRYGNYYSANGH